MYRLFIKGQKNKKKLTPEEAVTEIRKKHPVEQFVKTKQVKPLFNQLASLVKKESSTWTLHPMSKKTRKKVEIMTTIMKELGNFATQIYKNEKNIHVIHQMIKDIHASFPYYQKDP